MSAKPSCLLRPAERPRHRLPHRDHERRAHDRRVRRRRRSGWSASKLSSRPHSDEAGDHATGLSVPLAIRVSASPEAAFDALDEHGLPPTCARALKRVDQRQQQLLLLRRVGEADAHRVLAARSPRASASARPSCPARPRPTRPPRRPGPRGPRGGAGRASLLRNVADLGMLTRPPSVDVSRRRPRSSSSSSAPTSSRRQPLQRAHVRLGLAAAGGDDDRGEVGARGDQLVGEPGLLRAGAHERLGERDRRAVHGLGRRAARPPRAGSARRSRPRSIAASTSSPRRRTTSGLMPRIWRQLAAAGGLALGQLDHASGRAGSRRPAGPRAAAVRSRQAAELARDRALARVQPADARQPPPDLLGIALVGRLGDRAALLARPLEPAALDAGRCWISSASGSRCSTSLARVARAARRSAAARPSA